jgi:isopenicillin N synthase-like dioxygenase
MSQDGAGPVSRAVDEEIPVIDMGDFLAEKPGALEATAARIGYALERIGFFFVVNHGVPWTLRDRVVEQTARFHALPLEQKMRLRMNEELVGYMPTRGELPRTSPYYTGTKKADVGEAFFIRRDWGPTQSAAPNQWPEGLAGFRETLVEYYEALEDLAHRMLPLYAVALDLEPDYFAPHFSRYECINYLRMAHMPADTLEDDEFNVGPHTDSSFATVLATSDQPGLQLLTRTGKWMKAPLIREAFCVNSGDILTRWSNGRALSTPHRVINESGRDRYSVPFFLHPPADTMIECLPTCCGPTNPAKEPPISAGAYLRWFLDANFAIHDKTSEAA